MWNLDKSQYKHVKPQYRYQKILVLSFRTVNGAFSVQWDSLSLYEPLTYCWQGQKADQVVGGVNRIFPWGCLPGGGHVTLRGVGGGGARRCRNVAWSSLTKSETGPLRATQILSFHKYQALSSIPCCEPIIIHTWDSSVIPSFCPFIWLLHQSLQLSNINCNIVLEWNELVEEMYKLQNEMSKWVNLLSALHGLCYFHSVSSNILLWKMFFVNFIFRKFCNFKIYETCVIDFRYIKNIIMIWWVNLTFFSL